MVIIPTAICIHIPASTKGKKAKNVFSNSTVFIIREAIENILRLPYSSLLLKTKKDHSKDDAHGSTITKNSIAKPMESSSTKTGAASNTRYNKQQAQVIADNMRSAFFISVGSFLYSEKLPDGKKGITFVLSRQKGITSLMKASESSEVKITLMTDLFIFFFPFLF